MHALQNLYRLDRKRETIFANTLDRTRETITRFHQIFQSSLISLGSSPGNPLISGISRTVPTMQPPYTMGPDCPLIPPGSLVPASTPIMRKHGVLNINSLVLVFKGNVGGNFWETVNNGWIAYGLFREHRYHLELNWTEQPGIRCPSAPRPKQGALNNNRSQN